MSRYSPPPPYLPHAKVKICICFQLSPNLEHSSPEKRSLKGKDDQFWGVWVQSRGPEKQTILQVTKQANSSWLLHLITVPFLLQRTFTLITPAHAGDSARRTVRTRRDTRTCESGHVAVVLVPLLIFMLIRCPQHNQRKSWLVSWLNRFCQTLAQVKQQSAKPSPY